MYNITSKGLALAAKTLVENPDSLGELNERTSHHEFTRALAQLICDYCGGAVSGIDMETGDVSIEANDSLPDTVDNIWSKLTHEQDYSMYFFVGRKPFDDEDSIMFCKSKDYNKAFEHFLGSIGVEEAKVDDGSDTFEATHFMNADGLLDEYLNDPDVIE